MQHNLIVYGQKQLAGTLFNKLRAFDPYCILAGGAPERGVKVSKDFQLGCKTKMLWITNKLCSNKDTYVQKITAKFKDYRVVSDNQIAID